MHRHRDQSIPCGGYRTPHPSPSCECDICALVRRTLATFKPDSATSDGLQTVAPMRAYPFSGVCANCGRDRDDLFRHVQDGELYCADVFRCEARLELLEARAASLGVAAADEKDAAA